MRKGFSILIVLVGFTFGGLFISDVDFNNDPRSVLPKSDFASLKKEVLEAPNNNWEVVLIGTKTSIFRDEYFNHLDSVNIFLNGLDKVKHHISLASIRVGDSLILESFNDSSLIYHYPDIYPKFVSKNKKWSAIYYVNHGGEITGFPKDSRFTYEFQNSFTSKKMDELLMFDSFKVLGIALVIIMILLIYFLRNIKVLILCLLYILFCELLLLGVLGFFDVEINSITSVVPLIMVVVCISDLMHFFTTAQIHSDIIGRDVTKEVFKPITYTSITTLIGFFSLCLSDLKVLQELGLYSSLSIIIAYISIIYLLPQFYNKDWIKNSIDNSFDLNFKKSYSAFLALVIMILLIGIGQVSINQYLFSDYSSGNSAFNFIKLQDEQFEGVRKLKVRLKVKNEMSDLEVINELRKVESKLVGSFGLSSYDSYINGLKRTHRLTLRDRSNSFLLPDDSVALLSLMREFDFGKSHYSSDEGREFEISGKIRDIGTSKINKLKLEFKQDSNFSISFISGEDLLDEANFLLINKLGEGVLLVILIIGVLFFIISKSIIITLISMVVNFLPLASILGVMGWLEFDLNLQSAIIFTILFGIAVDDTIHFLLAYLKEGNIGASFKKTGMAIIRTSLVLIVGFGSLIFSELNSLKIVGLLMSIGILLALLCDIILLPYFLSFKQKKKPF